MFRLRLRFLFMRRSANVCKILLVRSVFGSWRKKSSLPKIVTSDATTHVPAEAEGNFRSLHFVFTLTPKLGAWTVHATLPAEYEDDGKVTVTKNFVMDRALSFTGEVGVEAQISRLMRRGWYSYDKALSIGNNKGKSITVNLPPRGKVGDAQVNEILRRNVAALQFVIRSRILLHR